MPINRENVTRSGGAVDESHDMLLVFLEGCLKVGAGNGAIVVIVTLAIHDDAVRGRGKASYLYPVDYKCRLVYPVGYQHRAQLLQVSIIYRGS